MNDKKNYIFIICATLIIFISGITAIASIISGQDSTVGQGYIDFSSGWLSESGEETDLSYLPESCTLHKEIPAIDSDAVLSFNARNLNITDVFIDDICVYKSEKPNHAFLLTIYGKTAGSAFIEVPVLNEYSGKNLYINIENPYRNGSACKIVNMYFGDGVSIVKHDVSIQIGSFCFSILILFIGIVCLVLYIPMGWHRMIDRGMLYLGLSAFTFGIVMITDSKLLHLVVGHGTLYYTVSQMFMVIIPVPLLLFIENLYGNLNKKIIAILCALSIIDFMAIFILNSFDIMDYHDNAFFVLLIIAASVVYIGFVTIVRMFRHDKDNLFHNIGVIMIAVSAILDMLITRNNAYVETSFFTRFGIAGFTCMECTQVLWKHIENYQKGVKAQLVSRLAYHDGLTDMLNRTSFMEDVEKLESEDYVGTLVAIFDINELKYVNDTYGHVAGDELIINVADSLKSAYHDIGKCYRIGGDEFVLISTCEEPEKNFIAAGSKLESLIKKCNEHTIYPVSVAIGYAIADGSCSSLNELLKKADDKMYAYKRQMKELVHR